MKWYHGSQEKLSKLRIGSSVTQDMRVAKAFSHRPKLVSRSEDGEIKHDGLEPGFIYLISEKIGSADLRPHPHPVNADRWEWLTNREMKVELMEETVVTVDERLTDAEIRDLMLELHRRGGEAFSH